MFAQFLTKRYVYVAFDKHGKPFFIYTDDGFIQGFSDAPIGYSYGLLEPRKQAKSAMVQILNEDFKHIQEDILETFFLDDGIYAIPAEAMCACIKVGLPFLSQIGYIVKIENLRHGFRAVSHISGIVSLKRHFVILSLSQESLL